MSLNEVLERGQRVRLLSGEKGIIIGKNETLSSHYGRSKLENGKSLTEARYRFDVLTEPEVSNDPGNYDSHPTVPEDLMHLFQSEIYESDDSDMPIVSPSSIRLPPPPVNYIFGAPIYKGTFNITNLVCYTYFHWFFNPECQHIFGKQTGVYISAPNSD